ncbi:hypothetical protein ACFCX4_36185, partial [Kitasatospora sp. NPDC056327]|uniref:acyl carrier protein n=1 Tax=Kitasatospora sp. NPDC056327 TaxID=3345785 RepID=UPI0035DDC495
MNPTDSGTPGTQTPDRTALLALAPADRRPAITTALRTVLDAVTGRPTPGDADEPLHLESLQATELQIVLDARWGVTLALTELVASQGLAALAEAVDLALTGTGEQERDGQHTLVPDAGRWGEPFGLTDVQHAYWLGRSGLFE